MDQVTKKLWLKLCERFWFQRYLLTILFVIFNALITQESAALADKLYFKFMAFTNPDFFLWIFYDVIQKFRFLSIWLPHMLTVTNCIMQLLFALFAIDHATIFAIDFGYVWASITLFLFFTLVIWNDLKE